MLAYIRVASALRLRVQLGHGPRAAPDPRHWGGSSTPPADAGSSGAPSRPSPSALGCSSPLPPSS
eukprot:5489640-Alexandrium_andersonii.AAC.1